MKILIHIHSNSFRKYIVSAFSTIGHTSELAQSASHILEELKIKKYDMVAFNVEMEGINGIDLSEEIRKQDNKTPILLFSSRKETLDKLQFRKIPFVEVLPTDIKLEAFKTIIKKYEQPKTQTEKILLVEDDKTNQILFKKLIKKTGFSLDLADNGKQAIELLSQEKYSIIFMDMEMPILNGIETSAIIRDPSSNVLSHDTPIIALTGNDNTKDRDKCKKAGMNDFLTKPIQMDHITKLIALYTEKLPHLTQGE